MISAAATRNATNVGISNRNGDPKPFLKAAFVELGSLLHSSFQNVKSLKKEVREILPDLSAARLNATSNRQADQIDRVRSYLENALTKSHYPFAKLEVKKAYQALAKMLVRPA